MGRFPIEATELLAKSIVEAENIFDHVQAFQEIRDAIEADKANASPVDLLCTTATSIAIDNNVDLFVCLTNTGNIARTLAKQRPF